MTRKPRRLLRVVGFRALRGLRRQVCDGQVEQSGAPEGEDGGEQGRAGATEQGSATDRAKRSR
jgi:hypothetical protein